MTPAAYVVLDEIPITAHGKIDRTALPEPDIMAKAQYREPATATERRIAALFSEPTWSRAGRCGRLVL